MITQLPMKKSTKLLGTLLLGVACGGEVFAGNQLFTFDIDPSGDPALNGAIIAGTHNHPGGVGGGFSQLWCSAAGVATNGNPATGGYLSITDATNGGNNLVFVFPDVDSGFPISGFQIDMDLRIGNGTLGRPADGFSVSLARSGDIALVNATNGNANGFAGGDGGYVQAQGAAGSSDVENGTKTGVAVVFDAWQGNWLPDTPQLGTGSSDREGIAVRVDDKTLIQLELINNRNWRDCASGGVSGIQSNLTDGAGATFKTNNGVITLDGGAAYAAGNPYTGGLSIQTGTNAVETGNFLTCAPIFGNTDTSGSFTNLSWEHLTVLLTNSTPTNSTLVVKWKGVTVISNNSLIFSPTVGRLVLAGRTGGNNENTHADNIHVATSFSTNTYLQSVVGAISGFTYNVSDNSGATVNAILKVLLDGNDVTATATTNVVYNPPLTTGKYVQATRFASASSHVVTVTWSDTANNTNVGSGLFIVPTWVVFPTNLALPLSAVDTTKVGFHVNAYQSLQNIPGNRWYAMEQLEGYHGPDLRGAPIVPTEGGEMVWDGSMDFDNVSGTTTQPGFFTQNNDYAIFGVTLGYPSSLGRGIYDNMAYEFSGYIYFPTAGVYTMVIGSDDCFELGVSQNPHDRLATVLNSLDGSRVPTGPAPPVFNSDTLAYIVDQPGVYPVHLLHNNATGPAALEWYTFSGPGALPDSGALLINDTNSAGRGASGVQLFTYRNLSGTVDVGPYVSKVMPTRGANDAVYFSPTIVDLHDGTIVNGTGKQVNTTGITLATDGRTNSITVTPATPVTHIVQVVTNFLAAGPHTNTLWFADSNGTNYTYSWTFTVIGGPNGGNTAFADSTNILGTNIPILLANRAVPVGNVSTPGLRIKSYQIAQDIPNLASYGERVLQGLEGPNLADQSATNGGPGFFSWTGILDLRQTTGTGAGGEWNYDQIEITGDSPPVGGGLQQFGIGTLVSPSGSPLGTVRMTVANGTIAEAAFLDIGCWMVFPAAGNYIFWLNTDDGVKVLSPQGNPFGKLGSVYVGNPIPGNQTADVGRGVAGAAGGVQTGGTWYQVNIPAAGAYPFRFVYFNSGGDGGFELSAYVTLSDGAVARVPINDPFYPSSIKTYQTTTSGDTINPYISFASPVFNDQDVLFYQPTIVELTDGSAGETVNTNTIMLTQDGVLQPLAIIQPSAGKTRITQQMSPYLPLYSGRHTNILVFNDGNGDTYSNNWQFVVVGPSFNIVQVPAASVVSPSLVDTTKPGFLVTAFQTISNTPNTTAWTEQQLLGVFADNGYSAFVPGGGTNMCVQTNTQPFGGLFGGTNGPNGTIIYTNVIDFVDNIGVNGDSGEYRYNFSFGTNFGFVKNPPPPSTDGQTNNTTLVFAGYMTFPKAGNYVMTGNSDDGFKFTIPYGGSAYSPAGTILGVADAGRGNTTGGAGNPFRGSVTPAVFNIPTAGTYPIRMLWENGGGGLNVEFSMFSYAANGAVSRVLIGDANDPNAPKVYQGLTTNPPAVVAFLPANIPGFGTGSGNWIGNAPNLTLGGLNGSQTGPVSTDFGLWLRDGATTVNPGSVTLSLNGINVPGVVATNGNGITGIFRFATNNGAGFWPSGQNGPLKVSFTDNLGNSYSYTVVNVVTPFDGGTLHGGYFATWADSNKPGFRVRSYEVDPAITDEGVNAGAVTTTGNPNTANRTYLCESVLAGYWGPDWSRKTNSASGPGVNYTPAQAGFTSATDFGYFDVIGTGPSNGVINFNGQWPSQAGDFTSNTPPVLNYFNMPLPGIPGFGPTTINNNRSNSFMLEILAYVQFPTNGTYTLGISSDDGFRVTQGTWDPPTNKGAFLINSPANLGQGVLAGFHPMTHAQEEQNPLSTPLTNSITGNLVLVTGTGGGIGATNGDGCAVGNPGAVAGNIAIMYRSVACGFQQQVTAASLAGARAAVIIQKRRPTTDGIFPEEFTIAPQVGIPAVMIEEQDGNAIVSNLQASVAVNVTLVALDNLYNQSQAKTPVLGQSSVGKGNNDCNFRIVVTNAPGIYPVRTVYFNGGGGVNVDWYSLTGVNNNRVLLNDQATGNSGTNGIALSAFFGLIQPAITNDGTNIKITYVGTLQTSPTLVPTSWSNLGTSGSTPNTQTIPISSSLAQQYFRVQYVQRQ